MKKEFWLLSFAEPGFDFSKWIRFVKDLENIDEKGGEVKIIRSNLMKMSRYNSSKFEKTFIDILTNLGFTIIFDENDPVLYDSIITIKKSSNESHQNL